MLETLRQLRLKMTERMRRVGFKMMRLDGVREVESLLMLVVVMLVFCQKLIYTVATLLCFYKQWASDGLCKMKLLMRRTYSRSW